MLVSTGETARHLRGLGFSERALARELGLSPATGHKLMTPGRRVLRDTAERALAVR